MIEADRRRKILSRRKPEPALGGIHGEEESEAVAAAEVVSHVLNRGHARLAWFEDDGDFAAFEATLSQAHARAPLRILSHGAGATVGVDDAGARQAEEGRVWHTGG